MNKTSFPYRVRKQSSGRAASVKYIVVKLVDGYAHRVSTWPHSDPQSAQAAADTLNIGAMVLNFDQDPRPYAERLAEATAAFYA